MKRAINDTIRNVLGADCLLSFSSRIEFFSLSDEFHIEKFEKSN